MNPFDITAALKKAGSSQAQVARTLKVANTTVYQVVHNHERSRRIALEIARQARLPVSVLWPGVYGPAHYRSQKNRRARIGTKTTITQAGGAVSV